MTRTGQTAWQISLLLGSGMGVMLLLRWLWWRVTALGELACIAASSVLSPIVLAQVPDEREALRLLLVAAGATLAGVGASLLRPARDRQRVAAFFQRVQPPGFWAEIAREHGSDPREPLRRLQLGLLRTAAAAFALFCTLVALGTLLLDGTVPGWFPWPALWSPTLLALALGTTVLKPGR